MLPGSFEATPTAKFPRPLRLRRGRFLPAGLAPLAFVSSEAVLLAYRRAGVINSVAGQQ